MHLFGELCFFDADREIQSGPVACLYAIRHRNCLPPRDRRARHCHTPAIEPPSRR
jgi:hypothetical protein